MISRVDSDMNTGFKGKFPFQKDNDEKLKALGNFLIAFFNNEDLLFLFFLEIE